VWKDYTSSAYCRESYRNRELVLTKTMAKATPPLVQKPTQPNLLELRRLLCQYPILAHPFKYDYGTAGFRYDHKLLPPVLVRMGILAALRSASSNGDQVGIMITASHNPEVDNGVKLVDSNGGMMAAKWEETATSLANARSVDAVLSSLSASNLMRKPKVVHIGIDTRIHSRPLAQVAVSAALFMGATVIDHGFVTTPQLHWSVMRSNPHNMSGVAIGGGVGGLEREYLEGMAGAYISLIRTANQISGGVLRKRQLLVDCACGIGGLKVPILNSILRRCEDEGGTWWMIDGRKYEALVHLVSVNVPGDGPLNENCGAEFVQKQQRIPTIFTERQSQEKEERYVASIDGDADRIVFHYQEIDSRSYQSSLRLLDGDKIAVLLALFLQEELVSLADTVPEASNVSCGVVQTAYANGSSTYYLKNTVKTEVAIAKTGVKYVHATAHSQFDIGIYFEANGHGTVLFGSKFYQLLALAEQYLLCAPSDNRSTIAWQRLRVLPRLINQAVGDALCDLLLVDAILFLNGWTLQTWNSLYNDIPSRQCKVRVRDRSVVTTNENETMATGPPSLQPALDSAIASLVSQSSPALPSGGDAPAPRAFVRPSGTENVVRVYAEAATQRDADVLASEAAAIVYKFCDGIGTFPNLSAGSKL